MAKTGVTPFMRVQEQPNVDVQDELKLGDSYFRIKLADAQAFFPGGPLTQADFLLLTTVFENSLPPRQKNNSLYKFTAIKKNTCFGLGAYTNLTQWLPARGAENIRIELEYKVTRGSPIKKLIDEIDKSDLAVALSPLGPAVAVGAKITDIVGHLLSFLANEGKTEAIFAPMPIDLGIGKLKAGYYAMVGALTEQTLPRHLEITENGPLSQRGGKELDQHSYAVFKVEVMPRLGLDFFGETNWGELLKLCRDNAFNAFRKRPDDKERKRILDEWHTNLGTVELLANRDHSVLEREIKELIDDAEFEVKKQSQPLTREEAIVDETYSEPLQKLLGVDNPQKLNLAVQAYYDKLARSRQLLTLYDQRGSE